MANLILRITVSKVERRESKRRQSEQEVSELIVLARTAWVSEQELQRSTGAKQYLAELGSRAMIYGYCAKPSAHY